MFVKQSDRRDMSLFCGCYAWVVSCSKHGQCCFCWDLSPSIARDLRIQGQTTHTRSRFKNGDIIIDVAIVVIIQHQLINLMGNHCWVWRFWKVVSMIMTTISTTSTSSSNTTSIIIITTTTTTITIIAIMHYQYSSIFTYIIYIYNTHTHIYIYWYIHQYSSLVIDISFDHICIILYVSWKSMSFRSFPGHRRRSSPPKARQRRPRCRRRRTRQGTWTWHRRCWCGHRTGGASEAWPV